jgi:hypothetical protein
MGDLIQYPDIASYQAGISLAGCPAVCAKATEDGGSASNRYVNLDFARARADAAANGVFFMAYHYLHTDDPAAEADFALSVIGTGVPTMVDLEAAGCTIADVLAFAAEYNAKGGVLALAYIPQWYWQSIGSPDLTPLAAVGIHVVSSNYPAGGYSDGGPGWAPYGGIAPLIWQYTDHAAVNGIAVDMNAFRGTVAQLAAVLKVDAPSAPPVDSTTYAYRATHNVDTPIVVDGDFGPLSVRALQFVVGTPVDGAWGPASIRALQQMLGVAVDGIQGPVTVRALQARVGTNQDGDWGPITTRAVQSHLNAGTLS